MNKKKLILTSGIANTFEWYDYALFGHFAPIIGRKFFPDENPDSSLLSALLVFAVVYLARPLGGIFFGIIGDRFGRRPAMSYAIMCMAIPTAAMGFLPTYESWGSLSTVIMIFIRLLQGLSMGGALTGSVSFVIEHSQKENRGFVSSFSMASICVGILLGSSASFLTRACVSAESFDSWAWRMPFILGIGVFFVGIYIKNNIMESPLFENAKHRGEIEKSPLKTAFKKHWFQMLISIFINATGSVIFYMEAIYLTTYLKITRGFSELFVNYLTNICYVVMVLCTLFSGWLSDRIGRKKIFIFNIVFIMIAMPYLLKTIESANFPMVVAAQIVIAIMAAFYIGPEPALQAELYPTAIRNTALAVSYNTATSIFGGTTPYIIESLLQNTGTITSGVYYIFPVATFSLVALYYYSNDSANNDNSQS
jgi:MHS family proline/betaine transporter-like MFS transporter